jgi:hypothetical protein
MPERKREIFPTGVSGPAYIWQRTGVLLGSFRQFTEMIACASCFSSSPALLVIVLLCLGAAAIWATLDAYRSIDRATAASAARVSQALGALYWRELLLRSSRTGEHLLPVPEWRTTETLKLISPGICLEFEPRVAFERPLCGQSKGIGDAAPVWFATTVEALLGHHATVAQSVSGRTAAAGTVSAVADPDAAIGLAWAHILDNADVALLMALAIGLLASLAIAHTLAPARSIASALQRMADGQYRTPLPRASVRWSWR